MRGHPLSLLSDWFTLFSLQLIFCLLKDRLFFCLFDNRLRNSVDLHESLVTVNFRCDIRWENGKSLVSHLDVTFLRHCSGIESCVVVMHHCDLFLSRSKCLQMKVRWRVCSHLQIYGRIALDSLACGSCRRAQLSRMTSSL